MIRLISVYRTREAESILYDLLAERTPEQSISHQVMPTRQEHHAFLTRMPYPVWCLIFNEQSEAVGSVYITKRREVGIFIFKAHQRKGYGCAAFKEIRSRNSGQLLANVAPFNVKSLRFFEKMGGKLIQLTYEL